MNLYLLSFPFSYVHFRQGDIFISNVSLLQYLSPSSNISLPRIVTEVFSLMNPIVNKFKTTHKFSYFISYYQFFWFFWISCFYSPIIFRIYFQLLFRSHLSSHPIFLLHLVSHHQLNLYLNLHHLALLISS